MSMEAKLNKAYDILVRQGGAKEYTRNAFLQAHLSKEFPCKEWRICGNLGFGAKFYVDFFRVNGDSTLPHMDDTVKKINEELAKIK